MPTETLPELPKKYRSRDEWRAMAVALFGPNPMDWRFVCPACGHVATVADWCKHRAPEGAVAFSCVGRWSGATREAFGDGDGPCNYAGGGLIGLNPVHVIDEAGGKDLDVFQFAPLPAPKDGPFYIVDLRPDCSQKYICFWRPNNAGYAYPLSWAGRYDKSTVDANGSYYCNTNGSKRLVRFPVSCAVVESLAIKLPDAGDIDGDAGAVLKNSEKVRRKLRAAAYVPPNAVTHEAGATS